MKILIKILTFFLILTGIAGGMVFYYGHDSQLRVWFFDIGQGDGILIRTPSHQNIIIDGGPDNKFISKIGQALPFYDREIDLMILTHPHDDHLVGLIEVLKRYEVKLVLYSGVEQSTENYRQWRNLIKEKNINLKTAQAGQQYFFGEIELLVLYPFEDLTGQQMDNLNNASVVNQLIYKDFKILFTGDLEKEGESEMIKIYGYKLASRVLKAGHHGSDTSSTEDLLSLVKPEIAVIQSGADNDFGHPSRRILKSLERFGVIILRNDLLGDILLKTNGQSLDF